MSFAEKLIAWQRRHGRRALPWQASREPYRVWLSEVMLQQTQVSVVIPYYARFLERFPDLGALAAAPLEEVLRLWSGLGYYARARNLHAAARALAARGGFPGTAAELEQLPGVGRSTAAAIAVFAFGERAAILDANVKRVLARAFAVEGEAAQWRLAEQLLPARGLRAYTQGLMDLGATVCLRANPACVRCPLAAACKARRHGRVSELPAPRRRKPLPLRRVTWLVLLGRGRVLLERRPPSGVWGGLWCFPELPARATMRGFGTVKRLPRFEHGFTHFRLAVQPVLRKVRNEAPGRGGKWMTLCEAASAAVPAPVRTLLLGLAHDQAL